VQLSKHPCSFCLQTLQGQDVCCAVLCCVLCQVAADEASHFSMLNQRLEAVGSHYGALPAHDG